MRFDSCRFMLIISGMKHSLMGILKQETYRKHPVLFMHCMLCYCVNVVYVLFIYYDAALHALDCIGLHRVALCMQLHIVACCVCNCILLHVVVYCIALYRIVSYCIVLYCIVILSYCIVLYCSVKYSIV